MEQDQAGTKPDDRLGQPAAVGPGEVVDIIAEVCKREAAVLREKAEKSQRLHEEFTAAFLRGAAAAFEGISVNAWMALYVKSTTGQRSDQRERSGRPNKLLSESHEISEAQE